MAESSSILAGIFLIYYFSQMNGQLLQSKLLLTQEPKMTQLSVKKEQIQEITEIKQL